MKKLYCLFATMFAGLSLSYAQTAPEVYPEPGEVESLETIEIDFGLSTVSIIEYSLEESWFYEAYVEGSDGTMSGTLSISKANPSLVLWNAYEKITTPGDVVFVIPADCLTIDGVNNPEYTYNYTITGTSGGDDETELVFGGYTANPASLSKVESISAITLTYENTWYTVDVQDDESIQVLDGAGNVITGVSAVIESEWNPENFTVAASIIKIEPAITADGIYTIVAPLYASNDWGTTRAMETIKLMYGIGDVELPNYMALGSAMETEGWNGPTIPYTRDIQVEGYDGYVIFRGFAGVDGYDLKVWIGPSDGTDAVGGVASIVNGVESEKYPLGKGYVNIPTGLDDIEYLRFYVGAGYCYGASETDGSGYFIISCFVGDDWGYYYIEWPQGDIPGEWENPFEAEATFLYSTLAQTCSFEGWGDTILPEVKDIVVDVYDTYMYIHGLLGVEGYDAKIAYDAEENVLSMISVVDGVEGEPCRSYLYLETGVPAFPTIQAYNGNSYAATYEDCSGYVALQAYIYDENDKYTWNYYGLAWDKTTGVSNVTIESSADDVMYNVMGQRVKDDYKGIVIVKGKKMLKK